MPVVAGCSDPTAFNFNVEVNIDDDSCIEIVYGCTDNGWLPNGIPTSNGIPIINDIDGDAIAAFNYNPDANTEDGSCIPVVEGCIDITAFNYDDGANTDNGSCIPVILGCIDSGVGDFDIDGDGSQPSITIRMLIRMMAHVILEFQVVWILQHITLMIMIMIMSQMK